jgi:hypothetical protein
MRILQQSDFELIEFIKNILKIKSQEFITYDVLHDILRSTNQCLYHNF